MRYNNIFSSVISIFGGIVTYLFGEINAVFIALLLFMIIDYLSGLIYAIVNKSVSSEVGFKGLAKKCFILFIVIIASWLDKILQLDHICKSLVCYFYIANEGISILENASMLGVPIPKKIMDILVVVKRKSEGEDDNE